MSAHAAAIAYADALGLTLHFERTQCRNLTRGPNQYAARVRALIGHLMLTDYRGFSQVEAAEAVGYASHSALVTALRVNGYPASESRPVGRPRKSSRVPPAPQLGARPIGITAEDMEPPGRPWVDDGESDGIRLGYDAGAW